ncbi:MAG: methyltransferase domain-containing protein [Rhodothermales bacterium]|nr:methyltransferase domain-containing protein [Rhodothermales bacterium]
MDALPQTLPEIGTTGVMPTYRYDLRTTPPDVFVDVSETDWAALSWKDLGRPYLVENLSKRRRAWEQTHGEEMPVPVQWAHFNRHFHSLFVKDPDAEGARLQTALARHLKAMNLAGAREVMGELLQLRIWNHVHRTEDAVWDPRGKRALFEGLDVERPEILFLGAADGYEAMQLLAMYPRGHAVLVDYDAFCETERFGNFPAAYPFLGTDPATGAPAVYRREDFAIDFEVADIRDLRYGREFDIVLSVGLIEHFPDAYKPLVFDFHRRFLKPGGYAVMTTPRRQLRSKAFYLAMGELMNYGYRELMDVRQMGKYAYDHGFEILRAGHIKAHNGVVAKAR